VRRSHTWLILIGLFLAAVVANRPLRRITLTIVRLPWTTIESAAQVAMRLPQLPGLAHENESLRIELAKRQVELSEAREALRRFSRLEQLEKDLGQAPSLVVSVIGRTLVPTQHVIMLDKGIKQGVKNGSVLVDARGLVGRVTESHPSASTAMLVTDPNSRIACLLERSRELGLLVGTGGSLCELIYLDIDADVEVNDLIVTAGLGGSLRKGLVVGTVARVIRNQEDGTTSAWVRPSANLRRLEELVCLPPSG